MPEWEVTATTVHCKIIDDEVTILVSGDATVTCTGRTRLSAAKRRRQPASLCGEGACSLMQETIARFGE